MHYMLQYDTYPPSEDAYLRRQNRIEQWASHLIVISHAFNRHTNLSPLSICHNLATCAKANCRATFVWIYIAGKKLKLGLSLDRPGELITNLTAPPAPKTSRKNGSV